MVMMRKKLVFIYTLLSFLRCECCQAPLSEQASTDYLALIFQTVLRTVHRVNIWMLLLFIPLQFVLTRRALHLDLNFSSDFHIKYILPLISFFLYANNGFVAFFLYWILSLIGYYCIEKYIADIEDLAECEMGLVSESDWQWFDDRVFITCQLIILLMIVGLGRVIDMVCLGDWWMEWIRTGIMGLSGIHCSCGGETEAFVDERSEQAGQQSIVIGKGQKIIYGTEDSSGQSSSEGSQIISGMSGGIGGEGTSSKIITGITYGGESSEGLIGGQYSTNGTYINGAYNSNGTYIRGAYINGTLAMMNHTLNNGSYYSQLLMNNNNNNRNSTEIIQGYITYSNGTIVPITNSTLSCFGQNRTNDTRSQMGELLLKEGLVKSNQTKMIVGMISKNGTLLNNTFLELNTTAAVISLLPLLLNQTNNEKTLSQIELPSSLCTACIQQKEKETKDAIHSLRIAQQKCPYIRPYPYFSPFSNQTMPYILNANGTYTMLNQSITGLASFPPSSPIYRLPHECCCENAATGRPCFGHGLWSWLPWTIIVGGVGFLVL